MGDGKSPFHRIMTTNKFRQNAGIWKVSMETKTSGWKFDEE